METESKEVPVSALYKGFAILELLGEDPATLSDIARRVGMPKSTATRFLASLVDIGMISRTEVGEYALTAKLFSLGARALHAYELVPAAIPHMRELGLKTSETVHLAVSSGKTVVYLNKVDSPHALRMHSRVGYQAPMYCTALGKCLLAWMPEAAAREAALAQSYEPLMPNTITSAEAFLAHLKEVRSQGWATDNEENEENVICFGAPVFNWSSQVIAAISVSMPKFRYSEEKRPAILRDLLEAARGISQSFGYMEPTKPAGSSDRQA